MGDDSTAPTRASTYYTLEIMTEHGKVLFSAHFGTLATRSEIIQGLLEAALYLAREDDLRLKRYP